MDKYICLARSKPGSKCIIYRFTRSICSTFICYIALCLRSLQTSTGWFILLSNPIIFILYFLINIQIERVPGSIQAPFGPILRNTAGHYIFLARAASFTDGFRVRLLACTVLIILFIIVIAFILALVPVFILVIVGF